MRDGRAESRGPAIRSHAMSSDADDRSPIENVAQVDVITVARDGTYVLIMVETRPWDGSGDRLLELQEKINSYVAFVTEGELDEMYPDAPSRAKRFQLDCFEPPDEHTAEFLRRVEKALAEHSIAFSVQVLPPDAV